MARNGEKRWRRGFLVLLVFIVLGAPIGGFVFVSPILIGGLADIGWSLAGWGEGLLSLGQLLFLTALFSYLFGGFSAVLCGLWLAWRVVAGLPTSRLYGAFAGAITSIPLPAVLMLDKPVNADTLQTVAFNLALFMGLGAVAAFLCTWLCRRWGLVHG